MQLPTAGDGGRDGHPYALVEVLAGPIPDPFDPGAVLANGIAFDLAGDVCDVGDEPCNVRLSVTSENVGLEALHIRANLCDAPTCNDLAFPADARPPYYLFEIAHPFYRGHRTYWHPTRGPFEARNRAFFAAQPTAQSEERRLRVHRCEVACDLNSGEDPLPDLGYCLTDPDPACPDPDPADPSVCRGLHACE